MFRSSVLHVALAAALAATGGAVTAQVTVRRSAPVSSRVEVLRSTGGVPPHLVSVFEQPTAFQQIASGQYLVFDRRGHTVYGIDKGMQATWKLVQIGQETGRVIEPTAFDAEPERGTFVIADAPHNVERIQIFGIGGAPIGVLVGDCAQTPERVGHSTMITMTLSTLINSLERLDMTALPSRTRPAKLRISVHQMVHAP